LAEDSEEQQIPVVTRSSSAPTFYADACWHLSWLNGVGRMAFIQNFTDPDRLDQPVIGFQGKHVANIVMPLEALYSMRDYLIKTLPIQGGENGD